MYTTSTSYLTDWQYRTIVTTLITIVWDNDILLRTDCFLIEWFTLKYTKKIIDTVTNLIKNFNRNSVQEPLINTSSVLLQSHETSVETCVELVDRITILEKDWRWTFWRFFWFYNRGNDEKIFSLYVRDPRLSPQRFDRTFYYYNNEGLIKTCRQFYIKTVSIWVSRIVNLLKLSETLSLFYCIRGH